MRTRLRNARNLGPVSQRELRQMGVRNLEDLRDLGWREVCLRWAKRFPARINLNAFRSVIGAFYSVGWNEIPKREDQDAQQIVAALRQTRRRSE